MYVLTLLALLTAGGEGTAETGNPVTPLTDEDKIKLVITDLEAALLEKDAPLVLACISDAVGNRALNEVQANFAANVAATRAPEGFPLVYLRVEEVKIDGDKAVAKVEAFSYGSGKRIQAMHEVKFEHSDEGWFIAEAKPVNSILRQIGGITPTTDTPAPPIESETNQNVEAKQ